MKIVHGVSGIKRYRKPVVALGVFDGVHIAHRSILREAVKTARRIKGTAIALTFWPHPQSQESIYSLKHRLRLIQEIGIDICLVINLSEHFIRLSAVDFVKSVLYQRIGAGYVYVGRNFRFGRRAQGTFRTLEKLSGKYGFKLKVFRIIKRNSRAISSTYIRSLIKSGRLSEAEELLSRPVNILGTVIRGNSLAGRAGFSTANINPHHEVVPPEGVYAVRVEFNRQRMKGVCYIGSRPTLPGQKSGKHIEVHIFDFNKKIYGKDLKIEFVKKVRSEKKFIAFAALSQQVKKDILALKKNFPEY